MGRRAVLSLLHYQPCCTATPSCLPTHPPTHPPPRLQATPGFALFSTAEGGAAYVARDLLDLSSHIFKPEVQRRLRQCC